MCFGLTQSQNSEFGACPHGLGGHSQQCRGVCPPLLFVWHDVVPHTLFFLMHLQHTRNESRVMRAYTHTRLTAYFRGAGSSSPTQLPTVYPLGKTILLHTLCLLSKVAHRPDGGRCRPGLGVGWPAGGIWLASIRHPSSDSRRGTTAVCPAPV